MTPAGQPRRVLLAIDRFLEKISFACMTLGCVWIAALMLWIVIDTTSRSTGLTPLVGAAEAISSSVVGITFLFIPYVTRRDAHIRSTILMRIFPKLLQRALTAGAYLVGAGLFAVLGWASWEPMRRSWRIGEYHGEGALRVPAYPIRTLVVVMCALIVAEAMLSAYRAWRGHERAELTTSERLSDHEQA